MLSVNTFKTPRKTPYSSFFAHPHSLRMAAHSLRRLPHPPGEALCCRFPLSLSLSIFNGSSMAHHQVLINQATSLTSSIQATVTENILFKPLYISDHFLIPFNLLLIFSYHKLSLTPFLLCHPLFPPPPISSLDVNKTKNTLFSTLTSCLD